jgi:hypothetical protein
MCDFMPGIMWEPAVMESLLCIVEGAALGAGVSAALAEMIAANSSETVIANNLFIGVSSAFWSPTSGA